MTEASPRHFNRVALVTGGRGGLGQAICARLAESGTTVVSVDAKNAGPDEALQHGTTGRVLQVTCDVSDRAAAHAMMERALANLGAVDVLVNCAGITRDSSLAKMTPEQWHDLMKVNLDSLFNLCQPAVAGMRAAGYGRIVNISSVNGQTGQFGQTNYAAAKAGVHGFTMALAREVAAHGITVNTIAPGYCDTPMVAAMPSAIRDRIVAAIPVGRLGQPDDIARTVAFLAAPEAGFITGALIPVNGGSFMSF